MSAKTRGEITINGRVLFFEVQPGGQVAAGWPDGGEVAWRMLDDRLGTALVGLLGFIEGTVNPNSRSCPKCGGRAVFAGDSDAPRLHICGGTDDHSPCGHQWEMEG